MIAHALPLHDLHAHAAADLRTGISWDKRAKQYTCRVGYYLTANGRRTRAFQYLTADLAEANDRHAAMQRDWRLIKREWPQLRTVLKLGLPPTLRVADLSKPVWLDTDQIARVKAYLDQTVHEIHSFVPNEFRDRIVEHLDARDQHLTALRALGSDRDDPLLSSLPPSVQARLRDALRPPPLSPAELGGAVPPPPPSMTIEQGKAKFLQDYLLRVNKAGKFGRKATTYNSLDRELTRGLEAIDTTRSISSITLDDVRAICAYWMDVAARGVKARTGENRVATVRQMLKQWDSDPAYGFDMPKGAVVVMAECKALGSAASITRLDPAQLRQVLGVLPDDSRLHVLLGLNAGMYPQDISDLPDDALVDAQGKPWQPDAGDAFLKWRRSKTRRTNDFDTLTYLWPETLDLLLRCRAKPNDLHRMFLDTRGGTLTKSRPDRGDVNTIAANYRKRCAAAKVNPVSFIQLRKWGATAIAAIADLDAQMMYRAERPRGSSKFYVLLDYVNRLTPALKQFRQQLSEENVLQLQRHAGDTAPEPGRAQSDLTPREECSAERGAGPGMSDSTGSFEREPKRRGG